MEKVYIVDDQTSNDVYTQVNSKLVKQQIQLPTHHFPDGDQNQCIADAMFTTSQEYLSEMDCEVVGTVPIWIRGHFMRLGPGRFEWGDTKVNHFFDGDALGHTFSIKDGKVTYRSQFIKSEYHLKNEKYNRVSLAGFGTWAPPDPCANIFKRMMMYFIPSMDNDNTNVNIVNIQGKLFASTETPWMNEVDPATLDVIKRVNAGNQIDTTLRSWLAHPHYDEEGNTWIFSTRQKPPSCYQLVKIPPAISSEPLSGETVVASLQSSGKLPAYYHSFAMTENYFVLVENPYYIKSTLAVMTATICRKSILDLMQWQPEKGSLFRIIDRRTGKELRKCRANPMFIFHHGNAYEEDNAIIIDTCAYPNADIVKMLYLKNARTGYRGLSYEPPKLVRYRLPLKELVKTSTEPYQLTTNSKGSDFELLTLNIETPIINYDGYNGKKYKYMYGTYEPLIKTSLIKVNVDTKEKQYWLAPDGCSASEPYFIARPGAKEEDDGVIVSTVTGAIGHKSFLLVLNAKTFQEIARANMPVRIGLMIHGSFSPNEKMYQ